MARQATTGDIGDILLGVLAFHSLLVMAAITVDIRAATIMAGAALPTCVAVVHWKRMVRD
jgi:hypothetical protein